MTDLGASQARTASGDRRPGGWLLFRSGDRDARVDLDVVFDVLAERRRRIVIDYLRDHEGEWVETGALADRIADWAVELYDPASVSVESIEIDLAHGHLPKLEVTGLVDRDGRRVRYHGNDQVERFLDLSRRVCPLP